MSTSTGCMLGWYDGNGYSGTNGLQDMETLLGTHFAIVRIYHTPDQWGSVSNQVDTAVADGRLVLASHKPTKEANAWIKTVNGDYDTQITAIVNHYKALSPTEVIVCYFHEPYGNSSSGHQTPTMGKPSDFQAAFRYFAKAFSDAGADNVRMGYCEVDSRANATPDVCYPGDDAVDVLCHDYYNWEFYDPAGGSYSSGSHPWKSPSTLFAPAVALAKAANKPIIFGEVGCHPTSGANTRAQWLSDLAAYLKTGDAASYVLGLCHYHVDNHNGSGHYFRFAQGTTADGVATFTTKFSQDPYFLTQPIAVSLRKAPPTVVVPPTLVKKGGGIPSNIGFGRATVTLDSGPITITSAGAIPAPGDYISPEESAGLDFGTAVVTFSDPPTPGVGPYTFEPPVVYDVPRVLPETSGPAFRLMRHYSNLPRGHTVLLVDGHYVTRDNPTMDDLAATGFEEGVGFFMGGHTYVVSTAVGNQLIADGYTVGTVTPPAETTWADLKADRWSELITSSWGAI